ncbi:MAG: hypothetical protein ACJASV_001770 [Pseudorhodobacter sp.]|jgi:hypothetical protein
MLAFVKYAAVVAMLGACASPNILSNVMRASAKSVVLPVVQQRLPGPQAEAATICVIDNATDSEIMSLARDVGARAGTTTVLTITTILQRPATVQCVLQSGITGGLI